MMRAPARHDNRATGPQPRQHHLLRRLAAALAIAAGMTILAAGAAWAYFQGTGPSNPAGAVAATLATPAGGAQNGTATPAAIPIKWTAPAGYAPTGYTVLRCAGTSCTPSGSPAVGGCSNVITSVVTTTGCIDSDPGLTAGTTYTYVVEALLHNWTSSPGPAFTAATTAIARLTFTAQPSVNQNIGAKGTGVFSVSVALTDAAGAVAGNDSTDTVTLAIGTNPGGGVLSCTNPGGLTATAASGVATFSGCAITAAGTGYTLTASSATSPALTAPANANAFNIVGGAATQLGFTVQPSLHQNIQATGSQSFAVSVAVQDQDGNTITGDAGRLVTLAIGNNPGGGVLSCTNAGGLTVTDSAGVASFTGCAITKAGTGYTLAASSSGLAAPTNATAFNIVAGAANELNFSSQPSVNQNIQAAGTQTFAVSVAVQDQNGNPVTGDAGRPVTLAIGTNPGGGALSCSGGLSASDSSGVASFSGCAITLAGSGYSLTASSAGLAAPSNANAFNIVAGVASQLSFTTQPTPGQNIQATGTGSFSASVAVQDQNGNTLTGDGGRSVTLAIGTNPGGGVLSCSGGLSASDSSGVASFSGCAITLAGTGYKLTASATSMTAPTNAHSFNITAGNPALLGFANLSSGTSATCSGNPGTHTNACTLHGSLGTLLSYTGNVTLLDQNGNLTTNGANVPLSLTSTLGSLGVSPTATTITAGTSASPTFTASLSLGLGTVTVTGTVGSATFTSTLGP